MELKVQPDETFCPINRWPGSCPRDLPGADAALMASPAVLLEELGTTEAEIRDQVARVKRLREKSVQQKVAWRAAPREEWADARTCWEAVKGDLEAAKERLAGLYHKKQTLLGQLSSAAGKKFR